MLTPWPDAQYLEFEARPPPTLAVLPILLRKRTEMSSIIKLSSYRKEGLLFQNKFISEISSCRMFQRYTAAIHRCWSYTVWSHLELGAIKRVLCSLIPVVASLSSIRFLKKFVMILQLLSIGKPFFSLLRNHRFIALSIPHTSNLRTWVSVPSLFVRLQKSIHRTMTFYPVPPNCSLYSH